MSKVEITAVVLTQNEEIRLPQCLTSLSWVDQILVIDDYSSDKTVEVAKGFGAKVYQKRLKDFQSQRNYALKKVKTPWVLFVDADEEVPEKLKREIMTVIKKKEFAGFYFSRKNIIFGKWIKHSGWYPDWQLHLFKKKKGKYVRKVHEQAEVDGKVGELKNFLLHKNYQSISQYLEKLSQYTTLEADNQIESGYKFDWRDLIRKPTGEFLSRFFASEGYKDGVHGLVLALLQSFSEFIVYARVWEVAGFKDEETSGVFGEIEKSLGETKHWIIQKTKSPLGKILRKLK